METTRERKDRIRKEIRERRADANARLRETETERAERAETIEVQDQLTELAAFTDGHKRYSVHACEYQGTEYIMVKQVQTYRSGKSKTRRLTFSPYALADMIELLAHAAEAAEAMRERDRELLAEAWMIEEVA